ncbi:major facilitator superfamily domain-containing protein 1-like [Adelges cooleyi]|uniref:major facilitator superfamily domain-containing protein 1-like n=1 Tax=Adelges cooleyi TaxID=133065 RepID=UPI0021806EEC|nr:major facilitator superfamily domain-containing protein 1-like [Adelges cooleyi]XP_050425953.1 major facilitator superfamily domain-containing protein 1-like [Adelges cooleyi]XP_050425954.1 major facilitator superfamily domain-containing protein 1-like [Adelges cooleyi]
MEDEQPVASGSVKYHHIEEDIITWKHPSHLLQRLLALFFMCIIGFGSYFCYDNPGALQDNFLKDMNLTTSQFVYLYSWYAWPNVILCIVGGFLIDRVFGLRLGTIIYALLVVIGQIVFAAGAYFNTLWLMLLGRLIFGTGGESLAVAQNNYAVLWFKGKELNMVFGFQLSFARVGSTVNFLVMEPLYKYVKTVYQGPDNVSMSIVLLIASLTCVISLVSGLLLAWQDKRAEKLLHRKLPESGEVVKLTDVKHFTKSFWLISFIIVCYYASIFPFVALGKVFFEKKYNYSPGEANIINGLIYSLGAFLAPLFGFVIDKTGRNVFWVFISVLGTLVAHMLLTFTFINPYVAMLTMGTSYSMLASALWPLIAMVVPEYQMGTAYGIAQAVENLGLGTVALLTGIIVDADGYYMVELFFCFLLTVALLLSAVLWLSDTLDKGELNMSINQRHEMESNKIPQPEQENLLKDTTNED